MSKILSAFEDGKAFIAFITCGDPDLGTTAAAVRAAAENGADLIQLGIPFSDPTAEGPVIQQASIRALQGGVTTDKIFDFVKELRSTVQIPLVFTTYSNVVFSYGAERFLAACKEAEIDGLILPDLPFEEKEEFLPACRKYGVDLISMIAPSTEKRISMIAEAAEGFLYMTPGPAVPDTNSQIKTDPAHITEIIRRSTNIPCAISYDTATPEQVAEMAACCDGVIAVSAFVELLEKYGEDAPDHIGTYIQTIKTLLG
ncbi:MAG: tryptophan synthase subunit alpha [Lachnospiraceae bacterium]|nr:tryptophan synthase subunit alpha [Lachnospiraceae bacterium]